MFDKNRSAHHFQVRLLQPEEDIHRWLQLIQAVEMEQTGSAQTTEEQLKRGLQWPKIRRWVVEAPGDPETLVGYGLLFAQIKERSALDILVHPAWRRQGIGSIILEHMLAEARKIYADYANFEILDSNGAAIAFLSQAGFEAFSHAWMLLAPAEADFPPPLWPDGYSARSYTEVNDLAFLAMAMNRGYGDMWGHHENTAGGVSVEDAERFLKSFDPQAIFVIIAPDGSPAGMNRVESASKSGMTEDILDGPGIAPEHRQQKLQTALVLHGLAWLRAKGRYPVRLESWGDSHETIAQYEEIGFHVVEHYLAYRKDLRKA